MPGVLHEATSGAVATVVAACCVALATAYLGWATGIAGVGGELSVVTGSPWRSTPSSFWPLHPAYAGLAAHTSLLEDSGTRSRSFGSALPRWPRGGPTT